MSPSKQMIRGTRIKKYDDLELVRLLSTEPTYKIKFTAKDLVTSVNHLKYDWSQTAKVVRHLLHSKAERSKATTHGDIIEKTFLYLLENRFGKNRINPNKSKIDYAVINHGRLILVDVKSQSNWSNDASRAGLREAFRNAEQEFIDKGSSFKEVFNIVLCATDLHDSITDAYGYTQIAGPSAWSFASGYVNAHQEICSANFFIKPAEIDKTQVQRIAREIRPYIVDGRLSYEFIAR